MNQNACKEYCIFNASICACACGDLNYYTKHTIKKLLIACENETTRYYTSSLKKYLYFIVIIVYYLNFNWICVSTYLWVVNVSWQKIN